MTTLALAEVRDLDCIVSMRPLVLDYPSTERYARGKAAILRRILYSWVRAGLLTLEGNSLSPSDLVRVRSQYEGIAETEDYVYACSLTLTLDASDVLTIAARATLVDGRTYEFEVTSGAAVSLTFPEIA